MFGLGEYVVAGALVHHEAGQDLRAAGSVVMRLALPIAAGELAHGLGASTGGWLLAAGGGMVAAMAVDWLWLADDSYVPEPTVSVYARPLGGGVIAGITGSLR